MKFGTCVSVGGVFSMQASGRYRKQVSQPLQQTASQLKRGLLSTLMATHGDFTAGKRLELTMAGNVL